MAKIVLHIGHRKVGSTSLQHAFAQNAPALAAAGVFYPTRGRAKAGLNAHHNLAYEYLSRFEESRFDPAFGGWTEVLAEIDSQPLPLAAISSEAFSHFVEKDIEALAARLAGLDLRLILYFRRHDFWFRSQHNQRAKFGRRSLDVDAFLADEMRGDQLYFTLIRAWSFAEQHIHSVQAGENVVPHFARECGIDPATLVGEDTRRNASVPLKFIVAAIRLGEETRDALGADYMLTRRTIFTLSKFFRSRRDWVPSYSLFSLDHARRIEAHYRDEAEQLQALTGQRFNPLQAADYADHVADPLAFRFDDEETTFLARLRREIVRHSR